jgi:hypothetical protein
MILEHQPAVTAVRVLPLFAVAFRAYEEKP